MMIMKAKNLRAPAGRCLLTMALLFGLSDVSSAHPGDLVKSFGSAGTTTISVPMMDTVDFSSMFTVVDHDNRVLSAFRMTDSDREVLVAVDGTGVVDPTFGTGGFLQTPEHSDFWGLQIDSANRIVTLEWWLSGPAPGVYAVRRLPDGSLDGSFGSGGLVELGTLYPSLSVSYLALDKHDNVYIAGTVGSGESVPAVARLDATGNADLSFGSSGLASLRFKPAPDDSQSTAIAVAPDGSVFLGAVTFPATPLEVGEIIKFDASGSLDTTFASGGVREFETAGGFSGVTDVESISFDASGNPVVAGISYDAASPQSIAVARLDATGSFDKSFNKGNVLVLADSGYSYQSPTVMVDGRGRVLVTGAASNLSTGNGCLTAIRMLEDGTFDLTFGDGAGRALVGSVLGVSNASFTHDGSIVAFGSDYATGGTQGTVYEITGYDPPPILPPDHF